MNCVSVGITLILRKDNWKEISLLIDNNKIMTYRIVRDHPSWDRDWCQKIGTIQPCGGSISMHQL